MVIVSNHEACSSRYCLLTSFIFYTLYILKSTKPASDVIQPAFCLKTTCVAHIMQKASKNKQCHRFQLCFTNARKCYKINKYWSVYPTICLWLFSSSPPPFFDYVSNANTVPAIVLLTKTFWGGRFRFSETSNKHKVGFAAFSFDEMCKATSVIVIGEECTAMRKRVSF